MAGSAAKASAMVLASCVPSSVRDASLLASRKATDLASEAWTRTVVCRKEASAGSSRAASRAAARMASQTSSAPLWCAGGFQEEKGEGEMELDVVPLLFWLLLRAGEAQAALAGGAVAVFQLR